MVEQRLNLHMHANLARCFTLRSYKGVISFLFVDGSVKALNDSMDADTFSALGSRSGGEAITQEF